MMINNHNLIERKQYMQMLRDLKDQNIIKVIFGFIGRYVEINILPLQFAEYYGFMIEKSPNLSKNDILANFIHYDGIRKLNVIDWMLGPSSLTSNL